MCNSAEGCRSKGEVDETELGAIEEVVVEEAEGKELVVVLDAAEVDRSRTVLYGRNTEEQLLRVLTMANALVNGERRRVFISVSNLTLRS